MGPRAGHDAAALQVLGNLGAGAAVDALGHAGSGAGFTIVMVVLDLLCAVALPCFLAAARQGRTAAS